MTKLRQTLRYMLTGVVAGFAMVSANVQAADIPESSDPIIIGINEWTGQHITAYIAGHVLERI